jgi:hypothetical protein
MGESVNARIYRYSRQFVDYEKFEIPDDCEDFADFARTHGLELAIGDVVSVGSFRALNTHNGWDEITSKEHATFAKMDHTDRLAFAHGISSTACLLTGAKQ